MRVWRAGALIIALVSLTAACARTPNQTTGGGSPAVRPPAKGQATVVAENQRGGDQSWRIADTGPEHAIEGYADRVSVLPGESFRLYVNTTARSFHVVAYRVGYYGNAQARRVWASPEVPGRRQPAPVVVPGVNMVTTRWAPTLTVPTRGWPEGSYLLKLVSAAGYERYVPITVRSRDTRGKVVIMNAVTTWQAYNSWGGYSLYHGPKGFADRSRKVSFDRPYDATGASKFLTYEQPLIVQAEKLGIPLAYITNLELAADPHILDGARALLSPGHDEYWSTAMRAHATRARDSGTNIAFLGANAVNRHIRFEASPLGAQRVIVCYKSATEDPMYSRDRAETTQDWRLPPNPRPESVLTGVFYECNPVHADYVVADPDAWMFRGTGVRRGTRLKGLVAIEYDRVNLDVPTPRPIQIVAHSPVTCQGRRSHADSAYYTVRSGAGVFAVGTMDWVCALGSGCGRYVDQRSREFARQVTRNVLEVFAAGPAGRVHPARDNVARILSAGSR
ncbi:hypothetical protein C3Y87_01100 [Carbonactinospora thermoautotrophica]|uniref:N,N-dimethylformamidase beta subunit-like C-terminal domain-containing protein n=1 Tax=Carbonactinospora thermoautotrophica TaxID=1469144 RepID=A0A132NFS5_9ACTN|nr:N,N-dimethylformamidase beta subunit family domain-containing protein [Carbonactinospora thermoautotrophica]KWX02120.1 hypothetical protein LI90_3161 [Carbonactinospora thermoautotrophica]KWX03353.1 hypothetical protein TH66_10340 [Carbonactinospora thermoautotrophica]KWX08846.1 hypothetical protein TR74_13105 [Carbonactinospora thermoautotrophica]MCX9190031.1 hypothetical protein [Carbonactinospora thermoautotrophica]